MASKRNRECIGKKDQYRLQLLSAWRLVEDERTLPFLISGKRVEALSLAMVFSEGLDDIVDKGCWNGGVVCELKEREPKKNDHCGAAPLAETAETLTFT